MLRSARRSASLRAVSGLRADFGIESAVGQTKVPMLFWLGYTRSTWAALAAALAASSLATIPTMARPLTTACRT